MNILDWGVIVVYLGGIVALAYWLGRQQVSLRDYYLAGQRVPWWQSGVSIMATQLGAISFVSAPAFVALAKGGGLKWLCYEFGVPLGLILVMAVIMPVLHRGQHISIYEYLEQRFDRRVRLLVSVLFQLGRGLATAVSVLAGGLILSTALAIPTPTAIVVVGLVTLVYDVLGGMRVVILSDVLQMVIIVAGILVCGGVAWHWVGWDQAWQTMEAGRLQILDFGRAGLSAEGEYAFWPMVLGGMILYASYYGCDQSQAQRQLSVGSLKDIRKSLLFNALGRFPVVLMYCLMGVLVGAIFLTPEGLAQVTTATGMDHSALAETLSRDPDRMLPMFILSFLPHGLIGFLFVAVMAALMSSLDSAINSLSAVTMRDVYQIYIRPHAEERHYFTMSKVFTAGWGLFCIFAALGFATLGEATRHTTIVLINAVGSLLYGPILAAFILGIMTRKVSAKAVFLGVVVGILTNLCAWQLTDISWLWWNVIGFLASLLFAGLITAMTQEATAPSSATGAVAVAQAGGPGWRSVYALVGVYFLVIVGVCLWLQAQVVSPVAG